MLRQIKCFENSEIKYNVKKWNKMENLFKLYK